jgi:hypothetical protein
VYYNLLEAHRSHTNAESWFRLYSFDCATFALEDPYCNLQFHLSILFSCVTTSAYKEKGYILYNVQTRTRIHTYGNITTYLPMALQPLWTLAAFSALIHTQQSVGLLWRVISPSQGRYLRTEQHKHGINAHRHPCLDWDSNPRSQCSNGRRRFIPQIARPLWSAHYNLKR